MNGTSPKRLRSAWLTACSALGLAVAGCGGETERQPPAPQIEAAAAAELARTSEEIATLIESGDVCGAAHRADDLRAAVDEQVRAGTVPRALADELTRNADALVREVNCPAPPADEDEEEDEDDEKGKGEGKGKKNDGNGEDEAAP